MPIKQIRKRDGTLEDFEPQKIVDAIAKALHATRKGDGTTAKNLAQESVKRLEQGYKSVLYGVCRIRLIVEYAVGDQEDEVRGRF